MEEEIKVDAGNPCIFGGLKMVSLTSAKWKWSASQINQARKEIGKEEVKLPLFTNDMI